MEGHVSQQAEEAVPASPKEWYAINSEQQRVLGPFRSERECAQAIAQERRRWDVVPLMGRN
jgi:hypothetical protein